MVVQVSNVLMLSRVAQAEFRKGTGGGSSALPRLTLRRVRSVSRWNHHTDTPSSPSTKARGSSSSGAAAAGGRGGSEPWMDDTELTSAAQCIMSAGVCWQLELWLLSSETAAAGSRLAGWPALVLLQVMSYV